MISPLYVMNMYNQEVMHEGKVIKSSGFLVQIFLTQ